MIEMRVLLWPNGVEQLQFRHMQFGADASMALSVAGATWSEWKDVPRFAGADVVPVANGDPIK